MFLFQMFFMLQLWKLVLTVLQFYYATIMKDEFLRFLDIFLKHLLQPTAAAILCWLAWTDWEGVVCEVKGKEAGRCRTVPPAPATRYPLSELSAGPGAGVGEWLRCVSSGVLSRHQYLHLRECQARRGLCLWKYWKKYLETDIKNTTLQHVKIFSLS